ncbi:EAL domain-containing protein [Clostridium tagluense]|uniref:EAL domain-containing protein n=1 Tax=Clostridium tagluense TaxID=360422 RepID=UPI001C0D0435|nr:EAL domain-containing protein [Clostridium tagluense]MBU3128048.1 EAL domain-containing protein [Clostridium tagluense]
MKLYNKFLSGVCFVAVVFITIILFLSNSILLSDYEKIEENSIIKNVERVNNSINIEVDSISDFVQDYSTWDDTYTFSEDNNEQYISSNFSNLSSLRKFGINFMIYKDQEGKTILSKGFNLNTDKEEVLLKKIESEIILKAKKLSIIKHSESVSGLSEINNTPTIIVTEPITTSDGRKKSGGLIIVGRYLDTKQISQIGSSVKVNLSIEKYNETLEFNKDINWKNNVAIKNINKKYAIGYKILSDIEGNPYLVIKINTIREIYRQATRSITYFVIIVILISLIFLGIALFYLNKVVARKIMKMNTIIHKISDTKDLTLRMKADGNDEIASLASGFNDMLDELKKYSDQNLELANKDTLTGLPNRKMIIDNIKTTIDKRKNNGGKFAVLFIDLDDFKKVNDSLGHDAGDFLIQRVCVRFKNVISSTDVAARIGGDEFIILQNDINSVGQAENLALHIKNVLKESFVYMGNELYTAASIGISIYPDDGEDIVSLMKNSDIAMYEAKKNGGNCYRVYSGNMNKAGLSNLILESNLYKSLEKKEMLLYYQAITHVQSKCIIGFEALIRWKHDGKIIHPLDFIPMAENNGYIIELGEWVIREACRQCSEWHKSGMKIYVTVNITFKQIEQSNFVDIVSNALKEANMDSKYLVLEITENAAMQNVDLTIKTLKKIKNLGVSIALDDFGTGYSSLSYVNNLPVDILKIDRSLIINIAEGTQNIAIIKAIIAMAQSINIKVVVEGVEDIEQFIILKELKSYAIQGYLISKPIPAKEIKSLVERKINLP